MRTVFTFGGGAVHDDPRAKDKTVTGGKGANLAEMAGIGLPGAPPASPSPPTNASVTSTTGLTFP